jgi:predicted nucleotide-binding protein
MRTPRDKNPASRLAPKIDLVLLDRFGRDVTEQFLTGPPGARPGPEPGKTAAFAANRKAVMVIYGHDTAANTALFDWLRSIGLQPQEWSQLIHASGSASPYIGQVLDQTLRNVQAVIAFFTPDERVTAAATPPGGEGAWRFQARPNVLIEAGMALSTHPTRTILAVLGTQELPSDLAGRHYVRLSHTAVL